MMVNYFATDGFNSIGKNTLQVHYIKLVGYVVNFDFSL